ncbi:MAG TPA: PQQ-binding-like beta-propeller repeat protein [Candidatus Acidoferrales bacterium]|nr:PQQ-binding-like beta-propeller repeat protein [Candidatus Acidoferrales bacterium]
MKINELSKKSLSLFAVLLMLSIAIPLTALPSANAHTPAWDVVSYAYISAAPSPVGVGQEVYIFVWVDTPFAGALITNNIRRHDYELIITDPDGTNTTKTWDVIDDTTGVQAYAYTPDKVGNYTLSFNYPGEYYVWNATNTPGLAASSAAFYGDWFEPASAVRTLEVTEEQVPGVTNGASLPTEYWSRPINGENSNWYTIASNWLNQPYIRSGATSTGGAGYGRYQKDGSAPETQHVMWTKPIQYGGVVGGTNTQNDGEGYYTGSSYNPRFANAIIMQGTLFYQEPYGNSGGGGDYVAVDLNTGEEYWRINTTATGINLTPSFGYMYGFEDGNQHGVLPNGLLIASTTAYSGLGTVWRAYDARTGVLTNWNMTNVPSGSAASATLAANSANGASAAGEDGEYLIYQLANYGTTSTPSYNLQLWNSSKYQQLTVGQIGAGNWYPSSASPGFNATDSRMYMWNVSIPSVKGQGWTIFRDVLAGDRLLLVQGSMGTGPRTASTGANITCVSINPDDAGKILWSKSYDQAPGNVTRVIIAVDAEAGTFLTEDKETLEINGYDLDNGNHLWTSEPIVCEWDTLRRDTLSAYGNLYAAGYDGIVYCYDSATGELEWTYGNGGEGNSTSSGSDTVYGHYPVFIDVIADGKVYIGTTEHSPDQPLYKGGIYACMNATTGEEIWTLTGMGSGMYVGQNDLVADGYFVYLNIYDMQVYTLGKGASKITVDAPSAALSAGQSVVIKGTVTDIAAGTQQEEQAARFPNGVPCVSDASMKTWMEYVYMQQNKPTDVTGVDVAITVIDANGNYRYAGMATSDASGFYSYQWTPDITGKYTVIATFGGTNAYYGSSATTAFAVDEAAATPTPVPTAVPSAADLYFLPAVIGIILAIIIGFAVIIVLLMKKP